MSHLPIKWAERDDRLFITVEASSATDVKVDFAEKTITISGNGITSKSSEAHALKDELHLLKEIDPQTSTFKVLGVAIQICAMKKEHGYWNRLVEQPVRETKSWLSVDWNLWKDEDEEDEKLGANDFGGYGDLSSMMGGMGGMGGMGNMADMMGGMGGAAGDYNLPDSDDEDEGVDDDEDEDAARAEAHELKEADKSLEESEGKAASQPGKPDEELKEADEALEKAKKAADDLKDLDA